MTAVLRTPGRWMLGPIKCCPPGFPAQCDILSPPAQRHAPLHPALLVGMSHDYHAASASAPMQVFKRTSAAAALAAGIFHRREVGIDEVKAHMAANGLPTRVLA